MSVSPIQFGLITSFAIPFLLVMVVEWWGGRRPFWAGTWWAVVWSLVTGGIAVATLLPGTEWPIPPILVSSVLILLAVVVGWVGSRSSRADEMDLDTGPDLEPADRELFNRVLSLRSTPAKRIMTPVAKIVFCKPTATVEDLIGLVQRSGYSRIPLMESTKGPIRGFVQAKDLASSLHKNSSRTGTADLRKDVLTVNPDEPVSRLLDSFRQMRIHLALVTDGNNRPIGLITLGDIYRHLLGARYNRRGPAS